MLQFFKRFKGNEIGEGNFPTPDLYSPEAMAAKADINMLRFKLDMTDAAKVAEASFPGWGNLFEAFWYKLDISHLRLKEPVGAAIAALRSISGNVVYYFFIRDYSVIGDRLADNVYLSNKEGCMKFWEFMLLKANGVSESVIEEWSGIPAEIQPRVHSNGLMAIHDLIEATARREASNANTALATNRTLNTKETTTADTKESGSLVYRAHPVEVPKERGWFELEDQELSPKNGWIKVTW